ncbi:MAG TPA: DUF4276 family protein [Longimicrobium sp.]|nr:DUF4276 family protein [Longimicrobium sp.]
MTTIIPIVEGHGEVTAVPILIRRILAEHAPDFAATVARPIRTPKDALLVEGGVERAVELAARQTQPGDGILILIDADKLCPAEVARDLLHRATTRRPDRRIRAVLAKAEFEAWFLAGARSLRGRRGLADDLTPPSNPEQVRDAKGWLSERCARGQSYKPTIDQPALSQTVDLHEALAAPSFAKFVRDIVSLVSPE